MTETPEQFTLLLVDDNPTNLLLLAQIVELDLPEVRVLTATSAREGLALAIKQPVDGAFLDVQMPQMSGLEMCRVLKADPRTAEIPVVLITAHQASAEIRAEGLEAGAYDFITQPISNVEMLARIKVMLRICEEEQQQRRDRLRLQQQVSENSEKVRWLSGLLLSGDGTLAQADQQQLSQLAAELSEPGQLTEQLLIEKLSEKFPLRWRRTLFKLALLDEIPVPLAAKLSEIEDVEAVFAYLERHDQSLQPLLENGRYAFRPPVLAWLRLQAQRSLEAAECCQVLNLAADWYQQQEQPVAALTCLVRGKNYPAISQLLSQFGLQLSLDGYQPEINELLEQVPEAAATACGWLALYFGISRMQSQPQDVAAWFELACSRFVEAGDQRGELLVMSQQVIQYLLIDGRLELGDRLLPRYQQLISGVGAVLEPVDRIKVLLSLGFAELFFASRLEQASRIATELQAESLVAKSPELQVETQLLRVLLAIYQGRLRVGRAAVEQALVSASQLHPLAKPLIGLQVVAAELLFAGGELAAFRRQLRILEQRCGRSFVNQSAFGPMLGFYATFGPIAQGDYAAALEQLELGLTEGQAAFQPHLKSWFLQLRGWLNALSGHEQAARIDSLQGLELRKQIGGELFGLLNQLLAGATSAALGDYSQAETCLRQALQDSERLGEEKVRAGLHAWLALVCLRQGEEQQARQQLGFLFAQLERQKICFFLALTPDLLKQLLPLASAGSEHQKLLQRLAGEWLGSGFFPDGRLLPLLQLQTLGGFSLWRKAEPVLDLCEVGNASRQILGLLLVAPKQSLNLDLMMERLWPESSGQKARSSFDTALSRLRKALDKSLGAKGSRDYLVIEKGVLQLRQVQIDANEFRQCMEAARRQLQRQDDWQAELNLWQAERLWKGDFLAGFELLEELAHEQGLLLELRLEQLGMLARLLTKQHRDDEAERLLQDGLHLDASHEPLVRQLLEIAVSRGNQRQQLQVVENYRRALQAENYPAEEIDEILESLGPLRPEH